MRLSRISQFRQGMDNIEDIFTGPQGKELKKRFDKRMVSLETYAADGRTCVSIDRPGSLVLLPPE